MKRFVFILILFPLAFVGPVLAQSTGDGLKGVYYLNTNLTSASATVVDPLVSYRWYGCPPQPGMSGTSFSIRWTGQLFPTYSEPYTIAADVNGAVSIQVNGQTLVNHWTDSPPPIVRYSGVVTLTAGTPVPIEVDYFTNGANPTTDMIQLYWQSASQAPNYIPREALFSGAALAPTPTPQSPSACQAAVLVDGVLNEWPWGTGWSGVNRTVLGNVYGSTASFKALWDPANLYLGVTVTDSQLTNTGTGSLFDNSTVELFLDTANSKSITVSANDFQYFFRWNDTTAVEAQGRTTGVSMVTTTIAGGYALEVSIPWSTLGITPSSGTVLGLDVGIDVNHNGGNCRDGQLVWNGGSEDYLDASGYGQLTLASACPTPVSTPPVPVGNNPYVSPNPTNGGTVKFVYNMAEAGTAHIKVWNAWGNLVATLGDPKGAGLQSSLLNVSSLAPGHYFYRIELDYASGRRDSFKTQVMAVKK